MAVARTMLLRLQADASQYTKTMQMATKEQQILRKELDLWSAQSKKAVGSSAYLKKELEMQKQQQQLLQVQVKKTTAELETQAKKYGEDSRQAQNLRGRLVDLQLQQEKLNKSVKDAPKQIFKQQTAEIGGKIKNVGIGATAAVTAPIVAAGTGIYKTGEMYEQAYNTIRGKTGLQGSGLKQIQTDFKEVYGSVSSGADVVSSAVAQLYQRTNLTGSALQDLAKSELRFAKLTDGDVNEVIRTSTRVFGDWSIPVSEHTKTLDKLYKVTQLTGVSSGQLMEQLVFFGAPLRSMGINFGEAAALIGKFEKEGVNAELVLTSMRRAAVNMSKAGVKDIAGGFAGAVQNIKNAPNDTTAMKTAIDIFGARSANDMMRAIRENRFELGELFKALNDNSDSLTLAASDVATAGTQFEKLKHQVQNAIEPLGISFVEAVKSSMPMIKSGAEKLKELIDRFTALPDATKGSIIGIAAFVAVIGPALTSIGYMIIGLGALPNILSAVQTAVSVTVGFVKNATIAFSMWQAGVYTFGQAALAVMGPGGWIALGITVVVALTSAIVLNNKAQEEARTKSIDKAVAAANELSLITNLRNIMPELTSAINTQTAAYDTQRAAIYSLVEEKSKLLEAGALAAEINSADLNLKNNNYTYAIKVIDDLLAGKTTSLDWIWSNTGDLYQTISTGGSDIKQNLKAAKAQAIEKQQAIEVKIKQGWTAQAAWEYVKSNGKSGYLPTKPVTPPLTTVTIPDFTGGNNIPLDIAGAFDDKTDKAKTEADKLADAIKGVRDAVSSYMDKLKQATDSTQQFVGLFDRFERKTVSLARILRNMTVNRDVMISWQGNIAKLQNNGLNADFVNELIKRGASGYNEVKALAKSTPEQIAQLNALWSDQRWNAENIAKKQLQTEAIVTRQTVNQTVQIDIHGNEIKDERDINSLVDKIVAALSQRGVLLTHD